jgi:hypothetical protein
MKLHCWLWLLLAWSVFACSHGAVRPNGTRADVAGSNSETPLPAAEDPPAPPREMRTALQVHAAACTAADGSWRCKGPKPTLMGAGGAQPITPPAWTVTPLFLDPANVSGTASDSNDCVTSTTPCLSFNEIYAHRWGTNSPCLQQTTVLNLMSSFPAAILNSTDAVQIIERCGLLAVIGATGANETIASGVLAGVVAKALPNTLLQATLGAPTAAGQLIQNITHPSWAQVINSLGGGNFEISQPMNVGAAPFFTVLSENNSWANGDSYVVYTQDRMNLRVSQTLSGTLPIFVFANVFSTSNGPFSGNFNHSRMNSSGGYMPSGQANSAFNNCDIEANLQSIPTSAANAMNYVLINAGTVRGGTTQGVIDLTNDFVFQGGALNLNGGIIQGGMWERGGSIGIDGPVSIISSGYIAGNQTTAIQQAGRLQWNSAVTAVNTFISTSATPLTINGASTACSLTSVGVWACAIPITVGNIDAAAGPGGFGGNVIGQFGGRIVNTGSS